ncbi:hypothetical protein LTR27_006097 [Elasticomyces elasticus]|nr:hypothetical protein LTR27_006097 [Elasticomyces elasticus]
MELTIAFAVDDTYLAIFGTILAVVSVAVLSWIVAPDYEEAFFPIEEPTTAALVANGGTERPAGRLSISPPHVAFSFAPNIPVAPQSGPNAPNPPAPGPGILTVAVPVTTISVAPIAPPPSQLVRARQIIAEQQREIGDLNGEVGRLSSSLGASARMRATLAARLTAQQQAQAVPTIPARLYNTTGTQTEAPPVSEPAEVEAPSEQRINTTHDSATQTESPTSNDTATETIDDVPEAIDDVPETIDDVPKTIDDVPETIDDVPETIDDVPVTRDDVTVLSNADLRQWQDTQIAAQDQVEALQTRVRELEARLGRAGPVTSLPPPDYTGHIPSEQRTCDKGHQYTAYSQDDTCLECNPCELDEDFDNEPAAVDNASSTVDSQAAKPEGKGKGVDTVEHPNYHAVPQQTATWRTRLAARVVRQRAVMSARTTRQRRAKRDAAIRLGRVNVAMQQVIMQTDDLQQQPVQGLGITMAPYAPPAAAPTFEADNGMQLDRDDDVKMGSPESQDEAHAPTANEQPEAAAQQGGDGNFQAEQNLALPAPPNAPQAAAPTHEADNRMEQGGNDDMAIDSPVLPGEAGAPAANEQAGPPVQQEGDGGNGFPAPPNAERATTPVFAPELNMENAWDPNDPPVAAPPDIPRVPDTPPQAAAPTGMGLPAGGLRLPGLQHGPLTPTANDVTASPRQPVANHNGIPGQYQLPSLPQWPAAPAVAFATPNNLPPPGNSETAATAPTTMFGRPAANPNGGQAAPPGLPAPMKRPGGAIPTGLFFGGSSANPPRKDATSNVAHGTPNRPIKPLQGPGAASTLQAGDAGPARPVTARTNIFAAAAALDGVQAPVVNHNGIPGQHALPSLGPQAQGAAPNDVPANPVQPGANNGEPPASQQQPLGRLFGPPAPAENAGATNPPQFVFTAPNPGLSDRQAAQLEADLDRQLAADGDTDAALAQIPAPPNPQPEFAMGFVPGAGRPVPGRATGPPQRRRLGKNKAKAKEDTLQEALEKDPNAPGDDFEM